MNKKIDIIYRIWWIIYPLLIYFLLDLVIVWAAEALMAAYYGVQKGSWASYNIPTIAAIIFLLVSIWVCWTIYRKDSLIPSDWIYKHPQYFALLVLIGVLASHGLSALISFMNIDSIIGNYSEIESTIFVASPVLVIVQTIILAPLSEELLFRGILYNRLRLSFGGFWAPALISSAIFGVYHFNLAQGLFAFLFGLLACAVYDKINNLWAPVVLHAGGNLVSVILVYTGFTYPEVWVYVAVMAASLAAAWALYHFIIRPLRDIT